MSTAFWIVVAVLAVGTIAGGLLRIRTWLQQPAPPVVIEAAHRHDDEDDQQREPNTYVGPGRVQHRTTANYDSSTGNPQYSIQP